MTLKGNGFKRGSNSGLPTRDCGLVADAPGIGSEYYILNDMNTAASVKAVPVKTLEDWRQNNI